LLFWGSLLFRKVKWAHFTEKNIFSQEHHAFYEQLASSMMMLIKFGQNTVAIVWATFMLIEDVKFHWSKKLKTACYFTMHGARGLAVGV